MTNRERFLRVMAFEKVDRLPMIEWAVWWDKTVEAWRAQGLSPAREAGLTDGEALQKQLGLDLHMQYGFDITTRQTPVPAAHGAPIVRSQEEYERVRPTLYPRGAVDRERLSSMKKRQDSGEAIAWISLIGFFWGPRELLGIEPHLFAFYDEPELMRRMNADILAHNLHLLDQVYDVLTPDFMTFYEDLSYNNGPMLSEAAFDEFLLPYYRQIVPALRARGTRVIADSDGDITMALPWFERAGIEGILPLERQAGVDLQTLRKRHPKCLFIGHFDKMTMPRGEAAMRAEFERLLPTMRAGGFLPSVDHQTPPGVSLEGYRTYIKLFAEYARKV
jgi:hypothetical protein